ncbi:hypothetical protein GGR50DRAFT_689527 [Xylaria sp. CBS 124048]|nr:hypothetical protein GGR50DRAFT_689527 [Xylaria sp. CBS 124048]
MLTPSFINLSEFFYPIGNTPSVCLTQSIPPNASADILLLGCGDVRNILFTNHVHQRKMDITCCDIQKAVLARNILLLSLIIDEANDRDDRSLWSIYYHMYLDQKALDLLRSQSQKLCELSTTMDTWQASKYGPMLGFCDFATLADVRKMWEFYGMERRGAKLVSFKRDFESVLNEARARQLPGSIANVRSAIPVYGVAGEESSTLHNHYWKYGTLELNADIRAAEKHPNPAMLAGDHGAVVHYATNPLYGFHLALVDLPFYPHGPVSEEVHKLPRRERLAAVARTEFREWMASYKKHAAQVRLRFFSGDAIALAHTLQAKRATTSNTAHWYRNRYSCQPLELDGPDYVSSVAPLEFDVIDTSNLCDHLGSLILLVATSPLLRNHASSVLYTEVLAHNHSTYQEVLDNILCGDVATLSTLLELFPIEYWTNTSTNCTIAYERMKDQMYLRTCWKRPLRTEPPGKGQAGPTVIQFDAKLLAKTLYQVHVHMFRDEDYTYKFANISVEGLQASSLVWYHRASFASFLRLVQTRVACNWVVAMDDLMTRILDRPNAPMGMHYFQELYMYLHMMGVFSIDMLRNWQDRDGRNVSSMTMSAFTSRTRLASEKKLGDLRDWGNIPSVVCITLKIPRSKLVIFKTVPSSQSGTPYVHCFLHGPRHNPWHNIFQACQLVFGEISTRGKPHDDSFEVCVAEDDDGWNGTSGLIATFYTPAYFLVGEPRNITVGFGMHATPVIANTFIAKLGLSLNIYETTLDNSDAVYVTRYAPNQTRFPIVTGFSQMASAEPGRALSASLIAGLDPETGHIVTFTGRLDLLADDLKMTLKDGCLVEKSTVSPCEVAIRLGKTELPPLSFPAFTVPASQKIRIARKSSYVEVVARVAGRMGWADYPRHMYPISLQQGKPINWNVSYLNLRTCPVIDVSRHTAAETSWLPLHLALMLSAREYSMLHQRSELAPVGEVIRLEFKLSLLSLFAEFSMGQGRCSALGLGSVDRGIPNILILASNLRLNTIDYSVVLDCAIIPLHDAILPKLKPFLPILIGNKAFGCVKDAALQLWRHALAAFVERCRTWSHRKDCEYATRKAIPLATDNDKQFLCTCGNGHFPPNFITDVPHWNELSGYAVRAAISPAFWAPFVDCAKPIHFSSYIPRPEAVRLVETCANCHTANGVEGVNLRTCGRCKKAKYCSRGCQRADWGKHKAHCEKS